MKKSLKELAHLVGGSVGGDENITIHGVAKVEEAEEGEIAFAGSDRFLRMAKKGLASAVIVPLGVKDFPKSFIRVKNPRLAFAHLIELFNPKGFPDFPGIHPTALLGRGVKVGRNVSIGPYAVIGEEVKIRDNVCLCAQVYLGRGTIVGEGTLIHPQVVIVNGTVVGRKVIIHSGAVIGSDGFGFIKKEDGSYHKIPQVGKVVIGDEVEIGANVAIDRATLGETYIGRGSKIDNLVHIAHNVTLGKNVALVALVGISGSSTIGDGVILAGQAGVTEHVSIGENTVVAAKSGVTKDVEANKFVSGFPARSHSKQKRIWAIMNHLPELMQRVKKLEESRERKT